MSEKISESETIPVTEEDVRKALDAGGVEDAGAKELLVRWIDQCHQEADAEAAASPDSAEASNRANIKCDIKLARLYAATQAYKEQALETLEGAYEAALENSSTSDLAEEIRLLLEDVRWKLSFS